MSHRTIEELCEELLKKHEEAQGGGGAKAVGKQKEKGKGTARERLEKLLDPGTFVELDEFVRHRCTNFGLEKTKYYTDGVVTGMGTCGRAESIRLQPGLHRSRRVSGRDARREDLQGHGHGLSTGCPVVGINDSGGARIQEAVDSLNGYGAIFYRNTISSGVVPQLSIIAGPTAGGAVYSPALTDYIFMVEGTGIMHITGPAVIKAVTGEEVTSEELGGSMAHNAKSGNAHFTAKTEDECFAQVRKLLSYLPSQNNLESAPERPVADDPYRRTWNSGTSSHQPQQRVRHA